MAELKLHEWQPWRACQKRKGKGREERGRGCGCWLWSGVRGGAMGGGRGRMGLQRALWSLLLCAFYSIAWGRGGEKREKEKKKEKQKNKERRKNGKFLMSKNFRREK
jgi:hypothetical protein